MIQDNVDLINIIKMLNLILLTYYSNFKITNQKIHLNIKTIFKLILIIMIAIICGILKYEVNYIIVVMSFITILSFLFSTKNIFRSILTTGISLSINYMISLISIIISYICYKIFNISNDYINLTIIILGHILLIFVLFKIKRFKYGISFLKKDSASEYIDILSLNVSVLVLFAVIVLGNNNHMLSREIAPGAITFAIIMFITIQKSIQLYYKQKLLEQELSDTKEKLAKTEKDLKDSEKENIEISKKNHTITHKQKSLNHKIEEIMAKIETSTEISIDIKEIKDRVDKLSKEINEGKVEIELSKTGIEEIDDMLKYMQSECSKSKIDFQLQIKGNIHYMVNNLINKEDLETLIADHVRNAIIAIEHTDNINKSILVKLGKIDKIYSLYIYDSGIEFDKETLQNLGQKPSTTHAEEGGTGMGFMNTFDTLRQCKASLTINEIGKISKEDYTKVLIIKFDNKNEFNILSYREKEILSKNT